MRELLNGCRVEISQRGLAFFGVGIARQYFAIELRDARAIVGFRFDSFRERRTELFDERTVQDKQFLQRRNCQVARGTGLKRIGEIIEPQDVARTPAIADAAQATVLDIGCGTAILTGTTLSLGPFSAWFGRFWNVAIGLL